MPPQISIKQENKMDFDSLKLAMIRLFRYENKPDAELINVWYSFVKNEKETKMFVLLKSSTMDYSFVHIRISENGNWFKRFLSHFTQIKKQYELNLGIYHKANLTTENVDSLNDRFIGFNAIKKFVYNSKEDIISIVAAAKCNGISEKMQGWCIDELDALQVEKEFYEFYRRL